MKKGIVALLIVLALVALISPGIVGRLAEKSVPTVTTIASSAAPVEASGPYDTKNN